MGRDLSLLYVVLRGIKFGYMVILPPCLLGFERRKPLQNDGPRVLGKCPQ